MRPSGLGLEVARVRSTRTSPLGCKSASSSDRSSTRELRTLATMGEGSPDCGSGGTEHTEGRMQRIVVRPNGPLEGRVRVSGAKNSVLKLMAATVLAEGTFVLRNVPALEDVAAMAALRRSMGIRVDPAGDALTVIRPADVVPEAPYEQVERMRASIVVLGPLLARFGQARVALPGGDDFGPRPIDMHLQSLERLGATFTTAHGYIEGRGDHPIGTRLFLDFPSVGATENALMAAVLAKGETVIENAAREPEIADLAAFLNRMGANVLGAGSPTITVEGVDELSPVEHEVIPDRIEAATFLAALGVAGGEIVIESARPDHMDMLMQKLGDMGVRTSSHPDGVWGMARGRLSSTDVSTLPYPGVSTDYKPLFVSMLAVADGVGIVAENISPGRFRHADDLARMGAYTRTGDYSATARGSQPLAGAPVRARDIWAGAAL